MNNIKWVFDYFPYGTWVDADNKKVKDVPERFKCAFEGKEYLAVMAQCYCPASHGEAAMTSIAPRFVELSTLKQVKICGLVTIITTELTDDENFIAEKLIEAVSYERY